MLVPKSMINLKDFFGGKLITETNEKTEIEEIKERPKSGKPLRGTKTQRIVPYNKKFNPDLYMSSTQVAQLREAKECSFEPKLRSKSKTSVSNERKPIGFYTAA